MAGIADEEEEDRKTSPAIVQHRLHIDITLS
jgi:hypothetical protein